VSIKILIVDDSPVMLRSVRSFVEHETDWEVCGEAENGSVAVEMVRQSAPHVVLMDLSMPVMNGLDAAREIHKIVPDLPILLFTLHNSSQLIEEARRAGIRAVLSKSDGLGSNLIDTVRAQVPAKLETKNRA
jgi:DNA-binding NarL/FixJ family response regulator